MPFRILPVSLCSELRFRRAYTRWKAYEILQEILEKSWVFDQFLSVGLLKLHRRYQRFILSPTSLPFGILAITLCSELHFEQSCACWKAYETLYKIIKKSEHLSIFWASNERMVASVHPVLAISALIPLCMFPKKHRMNRHNHPMVPLDHPVLIHLFSSSQEFIRCSQKWDRRIILYPIFSTS
jgi:hypothetical protein